MLSFLLAHWELFASGGTALVFGAITALLRVVAPTALIAHWRAVLIATVALCAAAAVLILYVMLERSRAQLATANASYATVNADYQTTLAQNRELGASNANLGQMVSTQSATIDLVASEAQAAKAESASAVAAAAARQTKDQQTIARLTARIADPANDKGTCDDEIEAIRSGL